MSFEVISDDWNQWQQVMREVPGDLMDVHYLPEYYRGYAEGMGWWPHLAIVWCETQMAVMPFLVTQDDRLVSVHNFGGPLYTSTGARDELVRELGRWVHQQGYLSEAQVNLVPFRQDSFRFLGPRATFIREAVWVDLSCISLRGTTRRCAQNAEESGVRISVHPTHGDALKKFQHIYWSTMARTGAEDHWLYPPSFFPSVLRELGERATLLLADHGDWQHPEAGAILVHGYGTCYYHWAGSLNRFPRLGVSHLLVREAMAWARDAGFQRFYLGGGLRPGDGLEVFKRGFSSLREPVYRYQVG